MDIPEKVIAWKFGGKTGNLTAQHHYSSDNRGNGLNMFCKNNSRYLSWGKTNLGINLIYDESPKDHKIHFHVPGGIDREILTGEKVALAIGGGDAFLRYAHRTAGINLEWVKEPSFEWRIYGATSVAGKKIPLGTFVAIFNERVTPDPDFLVYLDRPAGADVGWTSSPDWKKKLKDKLVEEAIKGVTKALVSA